ESAQRLERNDQLRLDGYRVVAADEQHPEEVVANVPGQRCRRLARRRVRALAAALRHQTIAARPLAKLPDDVVVGHAEEPRRRGARHAPPRPGPECGEECTLHGIFAQLEMTHPHPPREHGHQAAILVAEEVLAELVRHPGSLTSTSGPSGAGCEVTS